MFLARASRRSLVVPAVWGVPFIAVAVFAPAQARLPAWFEFLGRFWFAAGGAGFIAMGWLEWWNGRHGLRAEPSGLEWHSNQVWFRGRLVRVAWSDIAALRVLAPSTDEGGLLLLLRKGVANPLPVRKGSRLVFVSAEAWRWDPQEAKAAIDRILADARSNA